MFTFLDLLVVVFLVLAAVSVLAASLMFLMKNKKVQKISFYTVVVLGVYISTVGIRVLSVDFPIQLAISAAMGLLSAAALVLERLSKGNEKKFMIARIMAVVALIVGIVSAFA